MCGVCCGWPPVFREFGLAGCVSAVVYGLCGRCWISVVALIELAFPMATHGVGDADALTRVLGVIELVCGGIR